MTAFDTFARLLGIKPDHAEDALHSERAARAVLTRRNLFAAGGALAAGSVFSFGAPAEAAAMPAAAPVASAGCRVVWRCISAERSGGVSIWTFVTPDGCPVLFESLKPGERPKPFDAARKPG